MTATKKKKTESFGGGGGGGGMGWSPLVLELGWIKCISKLHFTCFV